MGPLDAQVSGAFHFVRRNMRIGAVKHLGREDVPQYGEKAVIRGLGERGRPTATTPSTGAGSGSTCSWTGSSCPCPADWRTR